MRAKLSGCGSQPRSAHHSRKRILSETPPFHCIYKAVLQSRQTRKLLFIVVHKNPSHARAIHCAPAHCLAPDSTHHAIKRATQQKTEVSTEPRKHTLKNKQKKYTQQINLQPPQIKTNPPPNTTKHTLALSSPVRDGRHCCRRH